jgi:predicted metal-binding membrane protein
MRVICIRAMGLASTTERAPTLIESALQSERLAVAVPQLTVIIVCWGWIVVMALDMYGPMTGASRWMMTTSWDAAHLFLLWAMWAVMMTGMMLPSAAPTILLYGAAVRRMRRVPTASAIYALTAGYVVIWALFSVMATVVQRVLAELLLISPMMELTSRSAGAIVLIIAGVYQWTPLKQTCLKACESPLGFLMRGWRDDVSGAFRLGLEHGLQCLGCCWALMLLLFAGGVMNLTAIAALTVFVALEKLGPFGPRGTRISGAALVMIGCWMLIR